MSPGENAIIKKIKSFFYHTDLIEYYNSLIVLKSQKNNIAFIDYNKGNEQFKDMIILNSIDEIPYDYIYIDKSKENNLVKYFFLKQDILIFMY